LTRHGLLQRRNHEGIKLRSRACRGIPVRGHSNAHARTVLRQRGRHDRRAAPAAARLRAAAAPAPNYQWNPGYWGWGTVGYYWVPGTWSPAPRPGLYWTPGYWRHSRAGYGWNQGYWGPSVGFYGGVNYGYGYFGTGFVGGTWAGNNFRYNTAVVNVNRTVIHNTYVDKTVINKNVYNDRVSYNGGRGGISASPTSNQLVAEQHRVPPTAYQTEHATVAKADRNSYNKHAAEKQKQPPA